MYLNPGIQESFINYFYAFNHTSTSIIFPIISESYMSDTLFQEKEVSIHISI